MALMSIKTTIPPDLSKNFTSHLFLYKLPFFQVDICFLLRLQTSFFSLIYSLGITFIIQFAIQCNVSEKLTFLVFSILQACSQGWSIFFLISGHLLTVFKDGKIVHPTYMSEMLNISSLSIWLFPYFPLHVACFLGWPIFSLNLMTYFQFSSFDYGQDQPIQMSIKPADASKMLRTSVPFLFYSSRGLFPHSLHFFES